MSEVKVSDVSDEDFDRLWDTAFSDATQRQGCPPSDPVEQTTSRRGRRRRSSRQPSTLVSSVAKQQNPGKIGSQQPVAQNASANEIKPIRRRKSSSFNKLPEAQQPVAQNASANEIKPIRRRKSSNGFNKLPEAGQESNPQAVQNTPPYELSSLDQMGKKAALRQSTASCFSAPGILSTSEQDEVPEEEGAITSEFDSETLHHSKNNKDPALNRPAVPNQRSTKWDVQREAAIFFLRQDSSSFGGENEEDRHVGAPPYILLPTTFEVTAHKKTRKHASGLVLSFNHRNEIDSVMVKGITPHSIFTNTALREGHEILTINDHRVKYPQQAAKIVKSIDGSVELLVSEGTRIPGTRYVLVKTKKMKRDLDRDLVKMANAGLGIQLQTRQGLVQATHIDPDGLFANSSIYPGDILLTVNGIITLDEGQTMEYLLEYPKPDLIYTLVYSMSDLRVGLFGLLLSDHWEVSWSESYQEVTVSRILELGQSNDGKKKVSLVLNFQQDWSCRCRDAFGTLGENATLIERNAWNAVFKSEMEPFLDKVNAAIGLAVEKLRDAISDAKQHQHCAVNQPTFSTESTMVAMKQDQS